MAAFLNSGTYNQQSTNCLRTQHRRGGGRVGSSGGLGGEDGWGGGRRVGGGSKCIQIVAKHTWTRTLLWEAAALEMTRHLNAIWWHHAFRWPTGFTLRYVCASRSETETHPSAGEKVLISLSLNSSSQLVKELPRCRITLFLQDLFLFTFP